MNIYSPNLINPIYRTDIKIISGSSYSILPEDIGYLLFCSGSSTLTITLTGSFELNTNIPFLRYGTNRVLFNSGSGVTIRTSQTNEITNQYDLANALYIGTNEWLLFGGLA